MTKSFVSTVCRVALLTGVLVGTASAQVYKVEEDWQVVIATPDSVNQGPQIWTAMSPTANFAASPYFLFRVNFRDDTSVTPSVFRPGGLQLQCWSPTADLMNGTGIPSSGVAASAVSSTANETVTWTQRMYVQNGFLVLTIFKFNSTTWGSFTYNAQLAYSTPTALANMNAYTVAGSTKYSGVPFGKNNVTSMKLLQVRTYDSSGNLLSTDSTVRQVAP
jgi:hypothetical protein